MGAAFSLFGKVQVDGSAIKGLSAQMKASFGPVADTLGNTLKGVLMRRMSARAIYSEIKSALENASELMSESSKTGINPEKLQVFQEVAKAAGSSVDDLIGILKAGGDPADELTKNLKAAEDEMRATGQIISNETIGSLSDLQDKLHAIQKRIAPLIAAIVEALMRIYTIGEKLGNLAVAGGQILWGQTFGDKSNVEAGRELARENTDALKDFWREMSKDEDDATQKERSRTSIRKAADDIAAETEDQQRRANLKKLVEDVKKKDDEDAKHPNPFGVSGLVSAGALFGPKTYGPGAQGEKLDKANAYLSQIATNTANF